MRAREVEHEAKLGQTANPRRRTGNPASAGDDSTSDRTAEPITCHRHRDRNLMTAAAPDFELRAQTQGQIRESPGPGLAFEWS